MQNSSLSRQLILNCDSALLLNVCSSPVCIVVLVSGSPFTTIGSEDDIQEMRPSSYTRPMLFVFSPQPGQFDELLTSPDRGTPSLFRSRVLFHTCSSEFCGCATKTPTILNYTLFGWGWIHVIWRLFELHFDVCVDLDVWRCPWSWDQSNSSF